MFFLIIILLIIFGLIFIEMKIYIDFVIENSYNLLKARVCFFGMPFLYKTLKLSIVREIDGDYSFYLLKRKGRKQLTTASKIAARTGKLKKFLLKTNPWEFTSIKEIQLRADMGLGDAALTAVIAGSLQSLILTSFNFLHFKDSKKMHAEVYFAPVFEKIIFSADLKCILGIKIAHIISTLIKKLFKRRKTNDGTSN